MSKSTINILPKHLIIASYILSLIIIIFVPGVKSPGFNKKCEDKVINNTIIAPPDTVYVEKIKYDTLLVDRKTRSIFESIPDTLNINAQVEKLELHLPQSAKILKSYGISRKKTFEWFLIEIDGHCFITNDEIDSHFSGMFGTHCPAIPREY